MADDSVVIGLEGVDESLGTTLADVEQLATAFGETVEDALSNLNIGEQLEIGLENIADIIQSVADQLSGIKSPADESGAAIGGMADKSSESIEEIGKAADNAGGDLGDLGDKGESSLMKVAAAATAVSTTFLAVVEAVKIVYSAVSSLVGVVTGFVDSAAEAEVGMARLNAINEATGQSAGFTTAQLDEMATALSLVTRFEDDVVKGAETMLLKFKNIRGDIFQDAIIGAADLAEAMGQDLSSASQLLGRALDQPVQGMQALRRSGITFTEAQKEMVEAMVKSGDVMGAQRFILDQLEGKFGGTAEKIGKTFTGTMTILGNRVGEIGESIGNMLLPSLQALTPVADSIVTAMENIVPAIQEVMAWGIDMAVAVQDGLQPLFELVQDVGLEVFSALQVLLTDVAAAFGIVVPSADSVGVSIRTVSDAIVSHVKPAFEWLLDTGIFIFTSLEVVVERWREVLELALVSVAHAHVKAFEEIKYILIEVIPGVLKWFAENWMSIFTDIGNFHIKILENMGKNMWDFVKSIIRMLKGDPAEFKFTSLLEGFELTARELPKIAARIEGETEKALRERTEGLATSLAADISGRFADRQAKVKEAIEENNEKLNKLFTKAEKKSEKIKGDFKTDDFEVNSGKDKKEKKDTADKQGASEGLEELNKRIAAAAAGGDKEDKTEKAVKKAGEDQVDKLDEVGDEITEALNDLAEDFGDDVVGSIKGSNNDELESSDIEFNSGGSSGESKDKDFASVMLAVESRQSMRDQSVIGLLFDLKTTMQSANTLLDKMSRTPRGGVYN